MQQGNYGYYEITFEYADNNKNRRISTRLTKKCIRCYKLIIQKDPNFFHFLHFIEMLFKTAPSVYFQGFPLLFISLLSSPFQIYF
jgi:hypothetical protein